MARVYSVSERMMPFFIKVCKRDKVSFTMHGKNEKGFNVKIDCSNNQFKTLIEDAMCELERSLHNADIPVYSFRTLINPEKKKRLMKMNNRRCFYVLRKDREKYLQYIN